MLEQVRYYFTEYELFRIQDTGITISHIAVAVVALVVSVLLSKITRVLLRRRVFKRYEIDPGLEYALLRVTHYLILVIGVYIGLKTINIPLGALVGLLAVLGVGIGFGLQNISSNFISGLILLFERPIKIGDRIEVGDVWGDVKRIKLRTTVVTTPDNVSIIIPNSKLLDNNVVNFYYSNRDMQLHVPVGVAYGSDIDAVTRILEAAAAAEEHVLNDPAPHVWFREFGDSSLNFELLCWIPDAALKYEVLNRLNRLIDARFREENIEIPFPQHDLHLRSAEVPIPFVRRE